MGKWTLFVWGLPFICKMGLSSGYVQDERYSESLPARSEGVGMDVVYFISLN